MSVASYVLTCMFEYLFLTSSVRATREDPVSIKLAGAAATATGA